MDQLRVVTLKGRLYLRCPERIDQFACPKVLLTLVGMQMHLRKVHHRQLEFDLRV